MSHNQASADSRVKNLVKRLREAGYRVTPQRLALLRILIENRDHPTAEEAYERLRRDFPTTSLATVYKTAALLKEMGELVELEIGSDARRYDCSEPVAHPHLVCNSCRIVIDMHNIDISELSDKAASQSGFRINGHSLTFFGLCPKCLKKKRNNRK